MKGRGPLPAGEATVKVEFDDAGGGEMAATVGGRFGIDNFGIGMDAGKPATFAYKPPFAFTGTIQQVRVDMR